jgi:hypothetical protein
VDTGHEKGNLRGVLCKKGQAHQIDAEKKEMTGIQKRSIRRGRPREAKIFDQKVIDETSSLSLKQVLKLQAYCIQCHIQIHLMGSMCLYGKLGWRVGGKLGWRVGASIQSASNGGWVRAYKARESAERYRVYSRNI